MSVDDKDEENQNEEDVDFDEMWDTVLKYNDVMDSIMGPEEDSDRVCPRTERTSCPPGHFLTHCTKPGEYRCAQCNDSTFQPSENWLGDKCRLRKSCQKPNMHYVDFGSTTRDANCACDAGYHFPNEDQRSCVPNKVCPRGYTHGLYGNCESCLEKSMYSTTGGTSQKCIPLTNCKKKDRCTKMPSDGTKDNVCGPVVPNIKICKDLEPDGVGYGGGNGHASSTSSTTVIIAGAVGGALFLILLLLILFLFLRRRRRNQRVARHSRKSLSAHQQEELRHTLLKEVDRNPALRAKAFTTAFRFIEERINKQIWDLARELFRSHPVKDKYEQIVKKFKETPSQAQRSIREYLQEWRQWRKESKSSLEELFRCLHQVKRENIINEICLCLSNDKDSNLGDEYRCQLEEETLGQECCAIFFPCLDGDKKKKKKKNKKAFVSAAEGGEKTLPPDQAVTKLLDIASDDAEDFGDEGTGGHGGGGSQLPTSKQPPGTFCSPTEEPPSSQQHPMHRPFPSAPVLEEPPLLEYSSGEADKYKRQYSFPVQATS